MANTRGVKSAKELGLEVVDSDSLDVEAREAIAAANAIGRDLEHLGVFIQEALQEEFDVGTFEALEGKALRLRSLADQVHHRASDLTRRAGVLEGLGLVRRAVETMGATDE
jgi:hypothetical protein